MNSAKTIPFFLILFIFIQCNSENTNKNKLSAPESWRGEILNFPLEFANSLKYSGAEYIQFAPGWGTKDAKDYFSYVLIWEINENPNLSSKKLEHEMQVYFDGLMKEVSETPDQIPDSKAFFEKVNDSLYIGKVITFDAFTTNTPLSLNMIIAKSYCEKTKKHIVRFDVSPQLPKHPVWKKLKQVTIDENCI